MAMVAKWLVVGGNRGIGLGLVEEILASSPSDVVYATTRDLDASDKLQLVVNKSAGRVIPIQADFNKVDKIPSVVSEIKKTTQTLDHIIINAGAATGRGPIQDVTAEELLDNFQINTVGSHHATQALYPLVQASKADQRSIAWMSSDSGTIGDIQPMTDKVRDLFGTSYFPLAGYAVSKAALNMLARQWALQLEPEGIAIPVIHPGNVATEATAGVDGLISVQESVNGVIKVLRELEMEQTKKGILVYDGSVMPW